MTPFKELRKNWFSLLHPDKEQFASKIHPI